MLNSPYLKGFLILVVATASWFIYQKNQICDCEKRITYANNEINDGINLDSLFRPADSLELQQVLQEWKNFNPVSDQSKIIQQYNYVNQRELFLLEHLAEGQKHYGVILTPFKYDASKKYPLMLWATGLNQASPIYNLDRSFVRGLFPKFPEYFIVIPSFRGQAIQLEGKKYCSDGFFGDAFDGATDDALRLLYLAQQQFSENVDNKKLVACGVSRGGTVALLAGIRNPDLDFIISQTGPTDFFSQEVYHRYNFQYKYQYLSKKQPMSAMRKKMLRSSPIHFIEQLSQPTLLLYGKNDRVVPLSNATKVLEKLEGKGNLEHHFLDAGHSFNASDKVVEWLEGK